MTKEEKAITAFGRYWKYGRREEKTGKLLGIRERYDTPVDMARQAGIYILHERERVVYVGKTESNGLIERLKDHKKGKKWERWDSFSWYGFRPVNKNSGDLEHFDSLSAHSSLADVLESLLIEVLCPYLNNQSGSCTGDMYVQVHEKVKKA